MICIYENVTDLSRTRDGRTRYGCLGWGGKGGGGRYSQKWPEGWRWVVKNSFGGDESGKM